jgi:hypothetical protein
VDLSNYLTPDPTLFVFLEKLKEFQIDTYSRGQKKVGQCFFANVNLLALSMVTMKIFIYLFIIVTPVYSTQFWLNFLIRLVLLFFVRDCM